MVTSLHFSHSMRRFFKFVGRTSQFCRQKSSQKAWPSLRAKQSLYRQNARQRREQPNVNQWFKVAKLSTSLWSILRPRIPIILHSNDLLLGICSVFFCVFSCKLQFSRPFYQATLSLALNDVRLLPYPMESGGGRGSAPLEAGNRITCSLGWRHL